MTKGCGGVGKGNCVWGGGGWCGLVKEAKCQNQRR